MSLIGILFFVLNIPVYLFIAWIIFDTKEHAGESFWAVAIQLLQILFVPRIVRILLGWNEELSFGFFEYFAFLVACFGALFLEILFIEKVLGLPLLESMKA